MILILSSSVALAADYDISITPIRDRITMSQQAQFLVTLKAFTKSEKFSIYSPDVEWSMPPETVKVFPTASESVKLLITPTKYIVPGQYGITINLRREDPEELIQKTVFVNVQSESEIISTYKPSIKSDVDMPVTITPDKKLVIRINVENQNVLNLTDLGIRIDSDIEALNTDREIQLEPLEEKIVEFTYELDPLQEPGDYRVSFELIRNNQTIDTISTRVLTVIEVKPAFEKSELEKFNFLKLRKELTLTSKSNTLDKQEIKLPVGLLERFFLSSVPDESFIKEDGKRFVVWEIELEPGQSKTIFITVNYRWIFYILVLVVLAVMLYFKYKSPVIIKKEVADVSLKEGGISQIRMMVELTNTSKKAVSDVAVVDYVPNIADVEQKFVEGTLKPTKTLLHREKGTILRWELPELAPGEDRLLSYSIKSKLSILGSFKLPRAKVRFKHNKKGYVSYSNSLGVNA